jgi:hypothetical protein
MELFSETVPRNKTFQGGVWGQGAVLLLYEVVIGRKLSGKFKCPNMVKFSISHKNMADKTLHYYLEPIANHA